MEIERKDRIFMATLWNRAGHYIFMLWLLLSILSFFFFFFFFFPRLISAVGHGCLPYFHTWCGLSANLECRSETCSAQLAENTAHKNDAKNRHLGTVPQICRGYIFATKAYIDNRKNLLSSNISSTCPHNMVNFGPQAAEIVSLV